MLGMMMKGCNFFNVFVSSDLRIQYRRFGTIQKYNQGSIQHSAFNQPSEPTRYHRANNIQTRKTKYEVRLPSLKGSTTKQLGRHPESAKATVAISKPVRFELKRKKSQNLITPPACNITGVNPSLTTGILISQRKQYSNNHFIPVAFITLHRNIFDRGGKFFILMLLSL